MTPSGETQPGARWSKPLLLMKATTRIGAWNVHPMYETDKAAQVSNDKKQNKTTDLEPNGLTTNLRRHNVPS